MRTLEYMLRRRRLVSVRRSTRPGKKLVAVFENPSKTTHFGAKTYGDFTTYSKSDKALAQAKKAAYIRRHKVNENWADPTSAGALSRFILWEKPTIKQSVAAFKRRFRV